MSKSRKHLADGLIIGGLALAFLAAGAGIWISEALKPKETLVAMVYHRSELVNEIDLLHGDEVSEDPKRINEYVVPDLDDHMTIGYRRGEICVLRSDCPTQQCVKQGWVSSPYTPIICAHYGVSIYLDTERGPDVIV